MGAGSGVLNSQGAMWTSEWSIVIAARPERIWSIWRDVAHWSSWNVGVVRSMLHGDFATGSSFEMVLPGGEEIVSVLSDVSEKRSFTDETCVGDVRVVVRHLITVEGDDRSCVTYVTEATGPGCAEVGEGVTADFADVLDALRRLAERSTSPEDDDERT